MSAHEICLRIKDGKILIARKGKPFFPEPLHKNVIVINPDEEGFLTGPYPKYNTIIMPLTQYHKIIKELKKECPSVKKWKILSFVSIILFLFMISLQIRNITHL